MNTRIYTLKVRAHPLSVCAAMAKRKTSTFLEREDRLDVLHRNAELEASNRRCQECAERAIRHSNALEAEVETLKQAAIEKDRQHAQEVQDLMTSHEQHVRDLRGHFLGILARWNRECLACLGIHAR